MNRNGSQCVEWFCYYFETLLKTFVLSHVSPVHRGDRDVDPSAVLRYWKIVCCKWAENLPSKHIKRSWDSSEGVPRMKVSSFMRYFWSRSEKVWGPRNLSLGWKRRILIVKTIPEILEVLFSIVSCNIFGSAWNWRSWESCLVMALWWSLILWLRTLIRKSFFFCLKAE